eukprot:Opistho-2@60425
MNCILVDDERPALELLEDNVKRIPYLTIAASCRNPLQLIDLLAQQQVDLLFLDIHMPGINGLELLKTIPNPPMVILVTAYPEHALDGFNLDVIDYLVKPVPFSRFLKAVNKAHDLYLVKQGAKSNLHNDHVFVNANYALVKVQIDDITYIEGLKDYVKINISNGKPIITRMGLKGLEDKLGNKQFLRIHKSYIIALNKIESIQKAQLVVAGTEIPIGFGYRDMLHKHISHKNL